MTQENINVKADVTQVRDGSEYKGNISFDEHSFQYQLRFDLSISELDKLAERSPDALMSQIYLDVKDAKGRDVPLDDESKILLMGTAGRLAIEFYNNPQNRDSYEGFLGESRKNESVSMGIQLSHVMKTEYEISRIPYLEKFLETCKE